MVVGIMEEVNYGTITINSSITWNIPNFSDIVEKREYGIQSPEFKFDGETWSLSMVKIEECGVTWFFIGDESEKTGEKAVHFCRLSIKDARGENYWTSCLFCKLLDKVPSFQGQFHSWLKRDASRIAPGDVLRLHLDIYPGGEPPREDADHGRQRSSSSTSDALPKTCTESLCNQGCSSNSFGELSQNFKDMFLNGEDCDATLNVKGRRFQVHAPILKSRSPVFAAMFTQEMLEKNSRVVDIEDCDPDAFHEFVLYLYSGRYEKLDVSNVTLLHYIAHKYGVEGLAATCVRFMIDNMAVEYFCEFAEAGLRHCESGLIESINQFLAENFKRVFSTEKWKAFSLRNASEAYDLAKKAVDKIL